MVTPTISRTGLEIYETVDETKTSEIREEEVPEASFDNVEPSRSSFPIVPVSTVAILLIVAIAVFVIRKRIR